MKVIGSRPFDLPTIWPTDRLTYWPFELPTITPTDRLIYRPFDLPTVWPTDHLNYQPLHQSTITPTNHLTYRPFDLLNMNESLVGMTKEKMGKVFWLLTTYSDSLWLVEHRYIGLRAIGRGFAELWSLEPAIETV
jgi:hypothetical protein